VARITSLNQFLARVGGYDVTLFEDMLDTTINLLKDLAENADNPDVAMALIMQNFNDVGSSSAIIYHLRILAASWLKGNPAKFEPFIPEEGGIESYCKNTLELLNKEIEHLGIILLVNVLLRPVSFVLEIVYLDRSPGTQPNYYRFPDEANGQDAMSLGPIIYLLFRPDHYDILYKKPPNIQVNRVASFTHQHDITSNARSLHAFSTVDFSPLAMLPGGFSMPPSDLSPLASLTPSPIAESFAPTPATAWLNPTFEDLPTPTAAAPLPPTSAQMPPPASTPTPPTTASASPAESYPVRFSHEYYRLFPMLDVAPEPSFTTSMFKNSHYNKAHYNNPHFHPEEWSPDDDGSAKAPSKGQKGKFKAET
jgi:ubiquitin thioesterase protein OTUB1